MKNWWKIAVILIPLLLIVVIVRARGLGLSIKNIVDLLPAGYGTYGTRSLEQITTIVIHHSASEDQTAFDYADYHISTHNWPGIGYHYVIDPDGTVNQTNKLTTVSYHVASNNTPSVGICVSGNLNNHPMTAAQERALKALISRLRTILPNKLTVAGHRDFGTTDCPGSNTLIEDFA